MLQAAPFWYWATSHEDRFRERLARYRQIVESAGRAPRCTKPGTDERRAYDWAYQVRQRRLGMLPGALTAEQIEQIEALPGWSWATPPQVAR